MSEQVLCTTCTHSYRPLINRIIFLDIYQCRLPGNRKPDEYNPVTGKMIKGDYISCGISRLNSGVCGPEGRHWQPRNLKRDLFVYLKRI